MEQFARPLMWNVPHWAEISIYLLSVVVVLVFLFGLWRRIARWRLCRAEPTGEDFWKQARQAVLQQLGRRISSLVRDGLFQWRLSSDPIAIGLHLAIFWGMVVLFIGTALATLDQDVAYLIFGSQFLVGNIYRAFELALDVFGVVLIVGLVGAVIRRYVVRTPRLQDGVPPTFRWDSAVLLASLLVIAVTGFVVEGLRLAEGSRLAAQDPAQAPWF